MRPELEAALAAADVAPRMMAARVGADQVHFKGGRDVVTATDVAVEDAIRAELLGRQPAWPVVGEERGGEAEIAADRPYWLVDPICGTRNFASGLPMYTVNVALVEDGRVIVGVIGDGASGDRYVAERGGGARLLAATHSSPRPLRVSDASDTITLDLGAAEAGPHTAHTAEVARAAILSNRWYVRMFGSSLAFALVAAGRTAAHLIFKSSSPVHTAAGCVLAEEAGGLVTDLDGRPWDLAARGFLAAATADLQHDLLRLAADARDSIGVLGAGSEPEQA